jgi:outer membrane protein assembly factor BamD (BamD/ComL family)
VAAPAHSAQASLSDELGALKRASSALNADDTSAALSALDQYDHVLRGTKMRAEATLLRIETLSRAGQAGAASQLAQRFVAQNPESPLVDRARSFVQQ